MIICSFVRIICEIVHIWIMFTEISDRITLLYLFVSIFSLIFFTESKYLHINDFKEGEKYLYRNIFVLQHRLLLNQPIE